MDQRTKRNALIALIIGIVLGILIIIGGRVQDDQGYHMPGSHGYQEPDGVWVTQGFPKLFGGINRV